VYAFSLIATTTTTTIRIMKASAIISLLVGALSSSCVTTTHAFVAPQQPFVASPLTLQKMVAASQKEVAFDQEQYIAESKEMRLKHLEEQAMFALKIAVENYGAFFFLIFVFSFYVVEFVAFLLLARSSDTLLCFSSI
jgi:hypothetical protein